MLQKELTQQQLELDEQIKHLTEDQVIAFKKAYQQKEMPQWRYYSLIGYNILAGAGLMYYTFNFKHFQRKYFKPTNYSLKEMIKYGTIQSSLFVSLYCVGVYVASGFWNPVKYVQEMSRIDGFVVDQYLKTDPILQEHFLINTMKYFGLSDRLIQEAQKELQENDRNMKQFYTKQEQQGLYKMMMERRGYVDQQSVELRDRSNDDDI